MQFSKTGLTKGGPDAIAFAVDEAPHLRQVAVPPGYEVDGGGLGDESVVGLQHPLDAIVDGLDQGRAGLAAHESPHLLKRGNLGSLWKEPAVMVKIKRKTNRRLKDLLESFAVFRICREKKNSLNVSAVEESLSETGCEREP